jgi:hypothetical protein
VDKGNKDTCCRQVNTTLTPPRMQRPARGVIWRRENGLGVPDPQQPATAASVHLIIRDEQMMLGSYSDRVRYHQSRTMPLKEYRLCTLRAIFRAVEAQTRTRTCPSRTCTLLSDSRRKSDGARNRRTRSHPETASYNTSAAPPRLLDRQSFACHILSTFSGRAAYPDRRPLGTMWRSVLAPLDKGYPVVRRARKATGLS